MLLAVFKYEPAIRFKQVTAEYNVGKLIKLFKIVGGIGKDQIVISQCVFQKPENIGPDGH